MKSIKITIFLLLTVTGYAQTEKGGVFLSYNDFINGKLSYEVNCKNNKQGIKSKKYSITVMDKTFKVKLCKDSIYGFLRCDEPFVRVKNKINYYLEEQGALWIYVAPKKRYKHGVVYSANRFYYSLKGNSEIMPLTSDNLRLSFQTDFYNKNEINAMLENSFKDRSLAEYDSEHKMFKLNYLLKDVFK